MEPRFEQIDRDFKGTPVHGWHAKTGNDPAVVELLLNAGAKLAENPTKGTEAVKAVLRRLKR